MNYKKLESAVKKYSEMVQDGASEADIKAALIADEKNYSAEEVEKIYAKLSEGSEDSKGDSDTGNPIETAPVQESKKGGKYIVTSPFADKDDRYKSYGPGDDISHFDQKRLDNIVDRGLAKKV